MTMEYIGSPAIKSFSSKKQLLTFPFYYNCNSRQSVCKRKNMVYDFLQLVAPCAAYFDDCCKCMYAIASGKVNCPCTFQRGYFHCYGEHPQLAITNSHIPHLKYHPPCLTWASTCTVYLDTNKGTSSPVAADNGEPSL